MSILQLLLAVAIVIIYIIFHLPTCIHYYMKYPISIRAIEMRMKKKKE